MLRQVSFTLAPGTCTGIAGASGIGKTTLMKLLVRLYEPWEGSVVFAGRDVRGVEAAWLRRRIICVLQEPLMWNDTLEANVRYADPGAGQREFDEACRACGVDELAAGLPGGYAGIIGTGGNNLSQGQKQRISIARALTARPEVLVLDEAMSGLDPRSEEKIISAIRGSYPDTTLVLITHRLSALARTERIIYLAPEGGCIQGTLDSLCAGNESFSRLFSGQDNIFA